MSAWKIAVQRMHNLGGTATMKQLDDYTLAAFPALRAAQRYGLVERCKFPTWTLTQKGRDLAEGRITAVREGPKGYVFHATWLAPVR